VETAAQPGIAEARGKFDATPAKDDQGQLGTCGWTRPPLAVRARGAAADLRLVILIARAEQGGDRTAAL
jgi:hypothetical protein